ncbi:STAS domain-containing protein [Roseiflexus sp. RS-1]|uniref:STAS domain-containing protein n=1 Tax=Roseiflexus sp. (strain RS-1) TaxID=357808 RepID=UPI0000D801FA|nr:STAS domain-containing protein [Roseiflexus sp. RS-1]ABQ88573.1 anti-sigma-factor antagonist [Roseiflexus sp. RS-1]
MHHMSRLIRVRHTDEDVQRRGVNIILIAAGLQIMALLLTIYAGFAGRLSTQVLIPVAISLIVQTIVIVLARRGSVDLAGGILVGMAIIGITGGAIFSNDSLITPIFLVTPLLMAAAALRPVWIIVALVGVLTGMGLIYTMPLPEAIAALRSAIFVVSGLIILFAALIGVLTSVGHTHLQRRLHDEVKRANLANAELKVLNEELDRRVQMQTEALRKTLQELEQQTFHQDQLLKEIAGQREVIRELSLPILPVGREVLVAPLIGALDQERMQQLQSQVLKRVERIHARLLILDVTGVPIIDTHVAQGLMNLVQGLRLLGANVALVGVRPEVAQTIVALGVHLRDIEVFSDLGSALQRAVNRTGARRDFSNLS